jgi:hypothetical protein
MVILSIDKISGYSLVWNIFEQKNQKTSKTHAYVCCFQGEMGMKKEGLDFPE